MSYPQKPGPNALSHQDRIRMERLSCEVAERVYEIARLLSHTLEVSIALPVKKFTLTIATQAADEPPFVTHEVTFADGQQGCHDFENMISCMGPCPCK
jgi:hypothetical protein